MVVVGSSMPWPRYVLVKFREFRREYWARRRRMLWTLSGPANRQASGAERTVSAERVAS